MQIEDFKEGQELPKTGVTENKGSLDEATLEVIKRLEAKISDLESKVSVPNGVSAPETSDTKLLRELVSQIKGGGNDGYDFKERYLASYEIDQDDQLPREKWVTFVCHKVGYVIVDDKVNGVPVRVPYGAIKFEYDSTRRIQNGKEVDVVNLSRYTCRSKKELEFLRNHSNYRLVFFENMRGTSNIDANKSMKLLSVFNSFRTMGIHDLIPYANEYGIDTTMDIQHLRASITEAYVDKQIQREKASNEIRVNDNIMEALALKGM